MHISATHNFNTTSAKYIAALTRPDPLCTRQCPSVYG